MTACERISTLPDLPLRPADAHKGTFGSVLLIAGSAGLSGAAILAGQAALHGGAGLVTVAVPSSIASVVAMGHPSYMTMALEVDESGCLAAGCIPEIESTMQRKAAVAIGPGLGQSVDVRVTVECVNQTCQQPLVLDADALNAFAGIADRLSNRPGNASRIITPHPGEFSRLTGLGTQQIQADRESIAIQFAKQHNVVVLLKGANTVITDGCQIAINATGNSGMATGGSGDVLTGLIVSLLAQGMNAFDAAQLGAHVHGLAGDNAAEVHSQRFMTSVELVQHLDSAWKLLQ